MEPIEDASGTSEIADDQEMLMQIIGNAKRKNLFPSFWEMDEDDIDEATDEEIQNDPCKKMLWAAEYNKKEVVQTLLEENGDLVNTKDADGYTPLHRASYNDHKDMVKILLSNGADIVAQTNDGWHPLHSAARWNCADVVSLLIQNGADINAQTNGGQTPLHLAASQKNTRETLEFLLMNCHIDTNIKNSIGETAQDICERTSELCSLFEVTENSINCLK